MARKTDRERDLIDGPITIRRTFSRAKRLAKLREFEARHGDIPDEPLDAHISASYCAGGTRASRTPTDTTMRTDR